MVRILFNEELHFLKKRAVVKLTKSELKRRIVKKCLDKQPIKAYNIYIMKIEKKNKKRVFQVSLLPQVGKNDYEIVFAWSKNQARKQIIRKILSIKELVV